MKLDPKPAPPTGVIRRFGDNVRGLLAIADCCGPEWGQRAREAVLFLLEKEQAERPHITIVRHGLAISTGSGSIRSEALTSIGMVRHFALEGKNPF